MWDPSLWCIVQLNCVLIHPFVSMRDDKCRCWFTAIDSVCLSELVLLLDNVQLMSCSRAVTLNLWMSLRNNKPRKIRCCCGNKALRWSRCFLPGRSEPSPERWTAAAQSDSPVYTWVQQQHHATSHWWVELGITGYVHTIECFPIGLCRYCCMKIFSLTTGLYCSTKIQL